MDYQDIYLQQTDSTNLQAKKLAGQGAGHGSGILADSQTAGRGRLAREWFSPPGTNLYCSYILRPAIGTEDFSKLTMVAGLATARYLNALSSVPVGLKWPNDIHIEGKKCGGILCESEISNGESISNYAIIGIGLNLNISQDELPEHLQSIATSLFIETGVHHDARRIYRELRTALLDCVRDFVERGFHYSLAQWRKYDTTYGKWLEWVTPDGRKVWGKSLGPDDDGLLQVEDGRGTIHQVISGDVNLARGGTTS
jgi:BirA family biotin operon repressor/biotin-[acetyl-CoA-carboxylase] ligase